MCCTQVPDNTTALHGTAFTVSINLVGHGVSGRVSANDRARTMRAAADSLTSPDDFARAGPDVFPLCACPGGVRKRHGHALVDVVTIATETASRLLGQRQHRLT